VNDAQAAQTGSHGPPQAITDQCSRLLLADAVEIQIDLRRIVAKLEATQLEAVDTGGNTLLLLIPAPGLKRHCRGCWLGFRTAARHTLRTAIERRDTAHRPLEVVVVLSAAHQRTNLACATMCVTMITSSKVGIRQLRQNLSVYVRRLQHGERFEVTDRGRSVGLLVPLEPAATPIERLVASGLASPAAGDLIDLGPPTESAPRALSLALAEAREERL